MSASASASAWRMARSRAWAHRPGPAQPAPCGRRRGTSAEPRHHRAVARCRSPAVQQAAPAPGGLHDQVRAAYWAPLDGPTSREEAEHALRILAGELAGEFPSSAACPAEDLPELTAHLAYPPRLKKRPMILFRLRTFPRREQPPDDDLGRHGPRHVGGKGLDSCCPSAMPSPPSSLSDRSRGPTSSWPSLNSLRDVATHGGRHLGLIFLAPMSVCQGVRPLVSRPVWARSVL